MSLINLTHAESVVRRALAGGLRIAVVVPCYKVLQHIEGVLDSVPDYVSDVVLVDDASPDQTGELLDRLQKRQPGRVHVLHLPVNRGVGGAVLAGFQKALELNADVIVKLDGDGQMDPRYMPGLIEPLILGKADYTKGNRMSSALSLAEMPIIRRLGNATLSFFIKISSGYWNVIDPANGYIAIRREVLELLPFELVHPRYFFESSMLIALRVLRAVVLDVPMDARYRGEKSNMNPVRILIEFPWQLLVGFIRRIWLTKILYSLTIEAILGFSGFVLVAGGLIWGLVRGLEYAAQRGLSVQPMTVLAAALPILIGFQMLMNAAVLDIQSVPTTPLCERFFFYDNPLQTKKGDHDDG
jgi:dolichol-phosphate mannosyltransferase